MQSSTQSTSESVDTQQNSPSNTESQSPSQASAPMPRQWLNHDALQRPRSHPPPVAHLFKPPYGNRGSGRSDIWGDSFGSIREDHDTISLGSWPTLPSGSHSIGNIFGEDHDSSSAGAFRPPPSWPLRSTDAHGNSRSVSKGQQSRQDKQIVVALRDDQLGQILHATSPPKSLRNPPHDRRATRVYNSRPQSTQLFNPPTAFVPSNGRPPSSAALARKSSYSDLTTARRDMSRKSSLDTHDASEMRRNKLTLLSHASTRSNKENIPPSQSRMPIPLPFANRVQSPNPFGPTLSQWDLDMPMRGNPSNPFEHPSGQTNRAPVLLEIHNKPGAAHAPNNVGIKSRKEGMTSDSRPALDKSTGHDQSLLLPTTANFATSRELRSIVSNTPDMVAKPPPAAVEIIDVDAIDPDLDNDTHAPTLDVTKLSTRGSSHTKGTSSTNSLGSVERKVITYVGAEVSRTETTSHGTEQDIEVDSDTIAVSLGGNVYETAGKRKRRGMVDSPGVRKREKAGRCDADVSGEVDDETEDVGLPKLTDE